MSSVVWVCLNEYVYVYVQITFYYNLRVHNLVVLMCSEMEAPVKWGVPCTFTRCVSELYHVGGSSHFTQTHGSSVPGVDACSLICLVCLLDWLAFGGPTRGVLIPQLAIERCSPVWMYVENAWVHPDFCCMRWCEFCQICPPVDKIQQLLSCVPISKEEEFTPQWNQGCLPCEVNTIAHVLSILAGKHTQLHLM